MKGFIIAVAIGSIASLVLDGIKGGKVPLLKKLLAIWGSTGFWCLQLYLSEHRQQANSAHWRALMDANPGQTLAELAPGYSTSGVADGFILLGCFLLQCICILWAVIPLPDTVKGSRAYWVHETLTPVLLIVFICMLALKSVF